MHSEEMIQDEMQNERLRWLMFYRVVTVSLMLGIAAVIQLKGTEPISQSSLYSIYAIIVITYLLSILYVYIHRRISDIAVNIYIQCIVDVMLITAMVFVTSGVESIYATLYPLVIIYAALFLGGKGVILIASFCSIMYGLLIDLEFYGIIHPLYSMPHIYEFTPGYVFSRIFTHISSFYIIAILSSFVVRQEKRARSLLSERENAFEQLDLLHRSIIESVGSGIMTADREGKIRSFNSAAEEITGYPFNEIRGNKVEDLFPQIIKALHKNQHKMDRVELNYVHQQDGNRKILGFSVFPLIDPGGDNIGNIYIFQDLTTIRHMEREVDKNKKLAFIGGMASVLAHELRTPLASIGGSLQLLIRDLKLDETDQKLMNIVLRGKDQLEELANNFLVLARSGSTERSRIEVSTIFDDIIESIRFGPDWTENIEIERKISEINDIYGNKVEIRQVFWNVILNALQSMPDGGTLKISTKVERKHDSGGYLKVVISDTGCGIEEGKLSHVLEPFYTTKERGTGLGLAIVSKIVEVHQGTLTMESELHRGTTCTILLPRATET